jgi:hypothetical protein
MAPSTRSINRETTPVGQLPRCEADTLKKKHFFDAYDEHYPSKSLRLISRENQVHVSTASYWLRQRNQLGSPAYRHTRKKSQILGRRSKVSKEQCKQLVSPSRNAVRDQRYEVQIQHHNLDISVRQLQRRLKQTTNRGQRYKQAYIQKKISPKNRALRTKYGQDHQDKTINNFWQFVYFTDEAHIDPTSVTQGYILREQGTRYKTENIQERPEKTGIQLHIAAWINWHHKAEKLEFYHDENNTTLKPRRPRKPQQTMYESKEDFSQRLLQWEATQSHEAEVKPKGNAMTQKYYTERLLPVYINTIQQARLQNPQNYLLQEDNDPSHGTRKNGLAQQLKEVNWITNLVHPAQSPDLNPKEGILNILKQRVRRCTWHSIDELKEVLQDEWSKITMEEVRARIADMPRRCKLLVETGGGPIKSALW